MKNRTNEIRTNEIRIRRGSPVLQNFFLVFIVRLVEGLVWLHVPRSYASNHQVVHSKKIFKEPRSKLTFLINGNPSFSRRQAFVYGSSTGFYSDSSSAAVAAAQTAAAAQLQGNLFGGC